MDIKKNGHTYAANEIAFTVKAAKRGQPIRATTYLRHIKYLTDQLNTLNQDIEVVHKEVANLEAFATRKIEQAIDEVQGASAI